MTMMNSRMGQALGAVVAMGLFALFAVPAYVQHRNLYEHSKRLREVTAGRLYRSGQMTTDGFREAIHRYGIRTVINVQDEFPDPKIATGVWLPGTTSEVGLCRELGVHYIHLKPDLCNDRNNVEAEPAVLAQWRAILDDPKHYPILLHCKAGLHRTGVLTAVYRMEYEGWSHALAAEELKAHGFGDAVCTSANDYVRQYVLNYLPRRARVAAGE